MTQKSRVAVVRGTDRVESIRQALDLVGEQIDWDVVRSPLIKPNFVSTERALSATHVDAVRALLDWLRTRYKGPIVIGEGAATRNTWEGFAQFGYSSLPKEYPGVHLRDLNADEPSPVRVLDRRLQPITLHAARTALESDCRISIGPPKTHDAVIVTLALKNMIMGSLISRLAPMLDNPASHRAQHGRDKEPINPRLVSLAIAGRGYYARLPGWLKNLGLVEWTKAAYLSRSRASSKQRMHQSLPLLNLNLFALAPVLRPHLSILDGWQAMEGDGPTRGDAVDWRVAVSSTDFLAADTLTSELMGYPTVGVGYLHYCHEAGLGAGSRGDMEIVGNLAPDLVRRAFRPSPTYRIQRRWELSDSTIALRIALSLNGQQDLGQTRRGRDEDD